MALEEERDFYQKQRPDLLANHRGQYALIHGQKLLGVYTTFVEAYEAGLKQVGNHPFLAQEITDTETTVQHPALNVGLISAHT